MSTEPQAAAVGAWSRRDVPGVGRKLASGEAGALLVLLMVAAIWTFFQFQNNRFLSPGNLTISMYCQC